MDIPSIKGLLPKGLELDYVDLSEWYSGKLSVFISGDPLEGEIEMQVDGQYLGTHFEVLTHTTMVKPQHHRKCGGRKAKEMPCTRCFNKVIVIPTGFNYIMTSV